MIAHIRERATLARDGKPHLAKDRHRKKFLVKVKIGVSAMVLRHWPIGKGFIVRLRDDDEDDGIEEVEGRPPYLFVKAWGLKFEPRVGMVNVKYDLRDTGFKVDVHQVVHFPDDPNKELLVWEAKREINSVEKASGAAANALKLGMKLRGKKGGAEKKEGGAAAAAAPSSSSSLLLATKALSAAEEGLDEDGFGGPDQGSAGRLPTRGSRSLPARAC